MEVGKTALACPAVVRGSGLRVITASDTAFVHVETPMCGDSHAPVLCGRVCFLEGTVVPGGAVREHHRVSKWLTQGTPGCKVRKFAMVFGELDNERMVAVPGDVVARSDDSDNSDLPWTRECTVQLDTHTRAHTRTRHPRLSQQHNNADCMSIGGDLLISRAFFSFLLRKHFIT